MSMTGSVASLAIPLGDYPHVRDDASLRDVFATLSRQYASAEQFRSVLMVDGQGQLLGMLGLRDLLHALLPDYLRSAPARYQGTAENIAGLALLWQEDCAEYCRAAGNAAARGHLTRITSTLSPADPVAKAVFLFATEPVNILPVVENGRVTGVLRLVDVLAEVSGAVLGEGAGT